MNSAPVSLAPSPSPPPPPPPATRPAAGVGADDSASGPQDFDKAFDAAKNKPEVSSDASATDADTDAAPAESQASAKPVTDTTKALAKAARDAKDSADDPATDEATSLAAAVLALIGIPAKVATVVGDALDKVPGHIGKTIKDATVDPTLASFGDAVAATIGQTTATTAVAAPVVDAAAVGAQAMAAVTDIVPKRDEPLPGPDAAVIAPAMTQAHGTNQAAPPIQLQSTQTAGSPTFAQELGDQIAWLGGQDIKQARIRLHPEELGQLDVKVSVQHGRVDVAFIAQHPGAVTAVQQTLSQLDSMLAHHGLSLGQADVSQQQAGQGDSYAAQHGGNGNGDGAANDDAVAGLTTVRMSKGLVDDFA
jgi:flagellar hook-length control protein FliK